MRIEKWSQADTDGARDAYGVFRAAQAADDPAGPPLSWHRAQMWLENPTQPTEVWLARDERTGVVTGFYRAEFPQLENHDRAQVLLTVHPAYRRRGTGTALLRHVARRAAVNHREVLGTYVAEGTSGDVFARDAGATPGLVDVRRVLHADEQTLARAASLREAASKAAAGYSLVSWSGRPPEEFIDKVAGLNNTMNDAPRQQGVDEQLWDADRLLREKYGLLEAVGSRFYEVAAIHDATGEMAALTEVELDPEVPEWGNQGLTAVTRPHRGHRLGMLVKTAMLGLLSTGEPGLRHVLTGNAAVNEQMIAINEALGFQILRPSWQGYDLPVTATLGG